MMERLEKQMEFILEVDKVKKIVRQTYLSDASRKENDDMQNIRGILHADGGSAERIFESKEVDSRRRLFRWC